MIIFNIILKSFYKFLSIKISLPLWAVFCLIVMWYSSIFITLRKVKKDELRREADRRQLSETIFVKDKYITNIMYTYVERVVEDIEDYEFNDKTKAALNTAISNITK